MPTLAYNAIRTTCTALFQQNLHQQSTWPEGNQEQVYWRLCVFWNVYISDRTISISCGRPASLHIDDINVEMPEAFCERVSTSRQITCLRDDVPLTFFRLYFLHNNQAMVRNMTSTSI